MKIELRLFLQNTRVKLWRYFVACLVHRWNQRVVLCELNVGYIEFKLQRYYAACWIQGRRSSKNLALLLYTRSIGHASTRRLMVHLHSVTKMLTAYRASSLIHAWRANNIGHATCSSVCSPYTPRMACIRWTLRKTLDFHVKNLLCLWQDATLDHLQRHFLEHTTTESFMRSTLYKVLDF